MNPALSLAGRIVAPVVVGIVLLGVWLFVVEVLHLAPTMIPGPVAIAEQVGQYSGIILEDALVTGSNALIGLAGGTILAILLAGLASRFTAFDGMLAPIIAAVAVIPIVALTPILNTMLGASAQTGRQVVAAIAAFIPVFVNVLRGLRQTRPVHRDLMRAYASTGGQTFRVLTMPTALPYLLTGVRIASSLAVISALVAEYFGGPDGGLGTPIVSYARTGKTALAWGYVGAAIAIGLVFFLAVLLVEWVLTRHRRPS
jgi:NitT/TauT family transport system permease protein